MRDLIVIAVVLAAIFFGVGEWRGWYLGIPGQTPVYVYKKDYVSNATRRTIASNRLPFDVTGEVRAGDVTVRVFYERLASFQTNRTGAPERKVFERQFTRGQRIDLHEVADEGPGTYRLQLDFRDATGLFRVDLPNSSEL